MKSIKIKNKKKISEEREKKKSKKEVTKKRKYYSRATIKKARSLVNAYEK